MPREEAERVSVIFSEIVARKAPIVDLENWNIGKDGKKVCLLTNGLPIIDNQGLLKGYRGVDKNITERKLAEEALKQSEAELNFAQQIARMGSWDFNLQTNKYRWSRNMYLILGYEPFEKEITYAEFLDLVHPDDRVLIDLNLQKILETKSSVSFDFRYILGNKEIIWVQNNMTSTFRGNKLIELHGINIDITAKKIAEQELIKAKENAETSDRLKTAFLNNISHEIRTPLNGILGFGQIITDPDFPEKEKVNYFKMLNDSSDRLLNTVTNFIDIAIITSGNQKVVKKEIKPLALIEEICRKYKGTCEEKGLKLLIQKTKLADNFNVTMDGVILTKILHQLIDNAIKFTSAGSIIVGIEPHENELLFYVTDSGIGISEEYKKRIFRNFDQEENSDNRKYEGTGIGLSIAKGLVELLGGTIWVESEKRKGATFYFTVPLA
jgi:PAS domain S-box-containing protein